MRMNWVLAVFARLALSTTGDDEVCLLQLPRQQSFLRRNGANARTRSVDAVGAEAEAVLVDADGAEVVRGARAGRGQLAASALKRRAGGCTQGQPGDYLPCTSLMDPFDRVCSDRSAGLRLGACEDAMW